MAIARRKVDEAVAAVKEAEDEMSSVRTENESIRLSKG